MSLHFMTFRRRAFLEVAVRPVDKSSRRPHYDFGVIMLNLAARLWRLTPDKGLEWYVWFRQMLSVDWSIGEELWHGDECCMFQRGGTFEWSQLEHQFNGFVCLADANPSEIKILKSIKRLAATILNFSCIALCAIRSCSSLFFTCVHGLHDVELGAWTMLCVCVCLCVCVWFQVWCLTVLQPCGLYPACRQDCAAVLVLPSMLVRLLMCSWCA